MMASEEAKNTPGFRSTLAALTDATEGSLVSRLKRIGAPPGFGAKK